MVAASTTTTTFSSSSYCYYYHQHHYLYSPTGKYDVGTVGFSVESRHYTCDA